MTKALMRTKKNENNNICKNINTVMTIKIRIMMVIGITPKEIVIVQLLISMIVISAVTMTKEKK